MWGSIKRKKILALLKNGLLLPILISRVSINVSGKTKFERCENRKNHFKNKNKKHQYRYKLLKKKEILISWLWSSLRVKSSIYSAHRSGAWETLLSPTPRGESGHGWPGMASDRGGPLSVSGWSPQCHICHERETQNGKAAYLPLKQLDQPGALCWYKTVLLDYSALRQEGNQRQRLSEGGSGLWLT